MTMASEVQAPPALKLTRLIAAPRALVWKAWTDPVELAKWWGPKDFTNPRCEIDARKGGALHIDMRGPDGTVYPMNGVVWELAPLERLVFTSAALNEAGTAMFEVMNTVTFADEHGATRMNLEAAVVAIHDPAAAGHLAGMEQGWSQSLDRLSALTARAPTVHASFTIERRLAFPPAKVFAAFSTPEAKAAWFGGDAGAWTPLRREFDFRVGGREQAVGAWKDGTVSAFDAVYHDIVPERRIVFAYSMRLDDRLISVSLTTIEFWPDGEGARLTFTEQGAFVDGYDDAGSREHGTKDLLDKMEASLHAAAKGG